MGTQHTSHDSTEDKSVGSVGSIAVSHLRSGSMVGLEQKIVEGRVHLIDYQGGNGIFCEVGSCLICQCILRCTALAENS